MDWIALARRVLGGVPATREEALAVLQSRDDELLSVLQGAFDLRRAHFGRGVNLHVLRNAQSGVCSENCAFCSQSAVSDAPIPRYTLQSADEIVAGFAEAERVGAVKYCIVMSARSPGARDLDVICEALERIRGRSAIHLCVSLGMLTREQARRLREAGANRINHNLETSRRYFPVICQSHTYDDRVSTLSHARDEGLELCCGGLVGMGETMEDRADLALALREIGVNSIPVNFFNARPGTPLADVPRIRPADCLRALAMFRFVNPEKDIRAAGGREANLGHLQALALYAANSIFTEGYLTTPGQGYSADRAMLEDAGFHVASLEA